MEDVLELTTNFQAITKDKELFNNCEPQKISKVLKTHPTQFQDSSQHKSVIKTVKNQESSESSFLLDNFPNLTIDSKLFEVDNSLPSVSAVLKTYPEEFGGQAIGQDLLQSLANSKFDAIETYFDNFSILSQSLGLNSILSHLFQNFDINTIYNCLENIPQLKNLDSQHLVKFLSTTDLRESNIKPKDVNIHIRLNDGDHRSPLHLAAKEGSTELVKVLLSKGADIEAKDD